MTDTPRGKDFTTRHYHYLPILKGKKGELDALQLAKNREKFTPLLEIPPIPLSYPPDSEEPLPAKSIDEHIAATSRKFQAALKGYNRVYIDGVYVEEEDALENDEESIYRTCTDLTSASIAPIPVVGLDRVEEYNDAVRSCPGGLGYCLRLSEHDLEGLAELEPQVKALLVFLGAKAQEVDLLLDFGPRVPSRAALPYQVAALPLLQEWRSLTVAASSFPQNLSGVRQHSITEIERDEWQVWSFAQARRQAMQRLPAYGDYAINHPDIADIDPRLMRMSPNIRYTAATFFVVAKGEAFRRKKDRKKSLPPDIQYPRLAQMIQEHASWMGEDFSWGDAFIGACGRGERTGNATTWRAVGTSHHIAYVVQQLANLP